MNVQSDMASDILKILSSSNIKCNCNVPNEI